MNWWRASHFILGEQEETVTCLNEGIAYEIPLNISTSEFENKITALRENFSDLPVDFNLVSSEAQKKLLIADMESTIIEQECLDELADRLNLRNKISDITSRAMRGEIDFEPALRERVPATLVFRQRVYRTSMMM